MWMADLKHGEHVDELPAYAPAFKEVYRFILEALEGNDVSGELASGELRCVMDLFPLVTSPVIHLMI
jgi:hypothetical protein